MVDIIELLGPPVMKGVWMNIPVKMRMNIAATLTQWSAI